MMMMMMMMMMTMMMIQSECRLIYYDVYLFEGAVCCEETDSFKC